jgi:hypothetical protein
VLRPLLEIAPELGFNLEATAGQHVERMD